MNKGETVQFVVEAKLNAAIKDIEGAEQEIDHVVPSADRILCASRAQAMASIAQARAMVALVLEIQRLGKAWEGNSALAHLPCPFCKKDGGHNK